MRKKIALIVTTIFEPAFIDSYISNIERFGHMTEAELIIIADKKTPVSIYEKSAFFRSKGYPVTCPTLDEQEQFLAKFPSMTGRIPYNSDNRRNIGFLMALESGAEVIISIDDDNYCLPVSDFIAEHGIVGEICSDPVVRSSDNWFNICTLLKSKNSEEIFPRGYPYSARQRARVIELRDSGAHRVAINAGLWVNEPDVDAVTRLALRPQIVDAEKGSVLLAGNTWSPVNTQNTAIARKAAAAYYYVRMGYPVGGMMIDRYGDILSGYFCQKCAKTLGEYVRFGSPVVDHRRTTHNLFKDLYHELAGMVIIEELLPFLIDVRIDGGTYIETYLALADALKEQAEKFKGFVWDQGGREFLLETSGNMRAWIEAVKTIA